MTKPVSTAEVSTRLTEANPSATCEDVCRFSTSSNELVGVKNRTEEDCDISILFGEKLHWADILFLILQSNRHCVKQKCSTATWTKVELHPK